LFAPTHSDPRTGVRPARGRRGRHDGEAPMGMTASMAKAKVAQAAETGLRGRR